MHSSLRVAALLAFSSLAACGDWHWPWDKGGGRGEHEFEEQDLPPSASAPGSFTHHVPHAVLADGLPPPITALKDGELTAADGSVISLHAFSWFGHNTDGWLHGLWQSDPMASDFATVLLRQKQLGFNAVRLPFSFSLFPHQPKSWVFDCTVPSDVEVAAATTDPNAGIAPTVMSLAKPPTRTAGKCNDYLPLTSVRDQFLFVVKAYLDNGFYVLADNHFREDNTALDSQSAWLDGWKALATDLEAYPPARGRVMFDLLNEPGQKGVNWDRLGPMYLAAMDSVWSASKSFPFLIEGTGQEGLGANWGDGFCTDPGKIGAMGLSDPTPFFTSLAARPYSSWVILGPHVYGPAVTNAPDRFSGASLWDRLDASFGIANSTGLTFNGKTIKYPVAIGEFGSKFEDNRDISFMTDFASYLNHKDGATSRPGKAIRNWFYWDWNADSGDTGGLVADDWKTIQWPKIRYLRGLGLGTASSAASAPKTPSSFVSQKASAASAPTPAPAPAPSSQAQTSPKPSHRASSPSNNLENLPPVTLPAQGPQMAASSSNPTASRLPPGDAFKSADGAYTGSINLWQANGSHYASINLFFSADLMSQTDVPFSVHIANPDYEELVQAWNMDEAKLEHQTIAATVTAPWAALMPGSHNVVNVGFIVRGKSDNLDPAHVQINGKDIPPPA